MSTNQTAVTGRPGPSLTHRAMRIGNRLVLPIAGTRMVPLYGVLTHRGRRSGKTFHTPVVARPSGDGFVIPMPWGESTDWYRNVRAAGGCTLRWKGHDYALTDPELIPDVAHAPGFGPFQRRMMARLGITDALRLRYRG